MEYWKLKYLEPGKRRRAIGYLMGGWGRAKPSVMN